MSYKIHFSRELCNGCKVCEHICATIHKGVSRIKIIALTENFDVLLCTQCEDQKCVEACDNSALFIDKYTGTPTISLDLCNKCMKCIIPCESSGLHYSRQKRK